MLKKTLLGMTLTLLLVGSFLSFAPEARATTVFAWDDTIDVCVASIGCTAISPTNLSEPVQGYAGISTFSGTFMHNNSGGNPAGSTSISVEGLAPHTSVSIAFLLAVIDSWDGNTTTGGTVPPDFFNVTVDGTPIFMETYDNFDAGDQSAPTSNQLAFGSNLGFTSAWPDSAYDMGQLSAFQNIPHTASDVTFEFFASGAGWQGGADESFAIEDIVIEIDGAASVPEPTTLMLLGLGLVGLGFSRRRLH